MSTSVITPEVLKTRVQAGGAPEVKKLIEEIPEGIEDKRKERVDRAKEVLKLLITNDQIKALSHKERGAAIEASRLVIQQELDSVTVELQSAAETKIVALKQKQKEFWQAKKEALELESRLSSLAGKAGIELRELKLDLKHASKNDKALLAGVAAVSGVLALWVYNKIWGNKENPGLLRRLGGLVVGAGAALAGVLLLRKRGPDGSDTLFKKVIEQLPSPAQAAVGTTVGISAKATERGVAQVEAVSHIPKGLYALLKDGDWEQAAEQGWFFVKKETGWAVTNMTEMFTVPYEFVSQLNNDLSAYEYATFYGAAGTAYILGRGTLKAVLTGKIALPLSARSLSMTAARAAMWPAAFLRDSVGNVSILMLSKDARVVARTSLQRWFFLGRTRDWHYRRLARNGTVDGLRKGFEYFQRQNRVAAALERQLEGPFRGIASTEGWKAVQRGNQHLANALADQSAALKAKYTALGEPLPGWLLELETAKGLSEAEKIGEAVDRSAAAFLAHEAENVADVDRVARGIPKPIEGAAEARATGGMPETMSGPKPRDVSDARSAVGISDDVPTQKPIAPPGFDDVPTQKPISPPEFDYVVQEEPSLTSISDEVGDAGDARRAGKAASDEVAEAATARARSVSAGESPTPVFDGTAAKKPVASGIPEQKPVLTMKGKDGRVLESTPDGGVRVLGHGELPTTESARLTELMAGQDATQRLAKAQGILEVESLSDAQKLAILEAHAVPPSAPGGGVNGSGFTRSDLSKKMDILRKHFPDRPQWKKLMKEGVCGVAVEEIGEATRTTERVASGAGDVVGQAGEAADATKAGAAAGDVAEGAGEAADASKAGSTVTDVAGGAGEAAKAERALALSEIANEKQLGKVLAAFGGAVSVDQVGKFLKEAEKARALTLDVDTLTLIGESKGAKRIIAGAVETGNMAEINRALKAARQARALRIAGNAVGAAGDAFAIYMAYADWQANGARIETAKETGNKALAEMYAKANQLYAAEAAEGTAGLVIGGVAIVSAKVSGTSLLTALGASGGAIMLPVTVAVLSGGYLCRKAEGVTETWMRGYKDWMKALSPGLLLEKLKELGPGKRGWILSGHWEGWGKGTAGEQLVRKIFTSRESYQKWTERGEKTIADANTMARHEITKAYVVRSSLLPREKGETDAAYSKRFDRNILDQMEFLTLYTRGTYAYMVGETYERAREYAELMVRVRELKAKGQSQILEWTMEPSKEKARFDLKDFADLPWRGKPGHLGRNDIFQRYIMVKKQSISPQLAILAQIQNGMSEQQKRQTIKQHLLIRNHDRFFRMDGRIANADFEGFGITGAEATGKALARYTIVQLVRKELNEQTDRLLRKARNGGLVQDDITRAIGAIAGILDVQDPLRYQRMGRERGYERGVIVRQPERAEKILNTMYFLREISTEG